MGYFAELQALPSLVSGGSGNRVSLIYRIRENPPVTEFCCLGNNLIPTKDIILSPPFLDQLGMPENATKLSESISYLEKMYRDRGRLAVRVIDVTRLPDGSLAFHIDEGTVNRPVSRVMLNIFPNPSSVRAEITPETDFSSLMPVYRSKSLSNAFAKPRFENKLDSNPGFSFVRSSRSFANFLHPERLYVDVGSGQHFLMDPFFSGSNLRNTTSANVIVHPKHVSPSDLLPPMLFHDEAGHLIR